MSKFPRPQGRDNGSEIVITAGLPGNRQLCYTLSTERPAPEADVRCLHRRGDIARGAAVGATHYPDIQQLGFALDVWHWPTVADLRTHLARYDYAVTAPWARACVVHHTVRPIAADWRGASSMLALARYYAGLGWSSGPHLFIASGSPDPAHDGIWQMTPLSVQGTHANDANPWTWGLEHVGRFDALPMPPDVAALGAGAAAALLDWASLSAVPATVQPHRRYNSAKSCPGRAVAMDAYIRAVAALQQRVTSAPSPPSPSSYTADSPILAPPGLSRDQLAAALVARCPASPYPDPQLAGLALTYHDLCVPVGVDPVVAVAQMCHETGNLTSFRSQPPQHNLAGIGATNDGATGLFFPSLEAGARAHVGRLVAYAVAPPVRSAAQRLIAELALAARPLALACQGSAPTLRLLGADPNPVAGCGWASPGPRYGEGIARVANALVEAR